MEGCPQCALLQLQLAWTQRQFELLTENFVAVSAPGSYARMKAIPRESVEAQTAPRSPAALRTRRVDRLTADQIRDLIRAEAQEAQEPVGLETVEDVRALGSDE